MSRHEKTTRLIEQAAAKVHTRPRKTHIFARDPDDRYVEPSWVSSRLFEVEPFIGIIHDPAAGSGQIVNAARSRGLEATGADVAPCIEGMCAIDFFKDRNNVDNVISNPPYALLREFALHALTLTMRKVALLAPVARLNAAGRWLEDTPLRRVWLLSPRPSIPPHQLILDGQIPQGGRVDFCWLIWQQGFHGAPTLHWLWRDGGAARPAPRILRQRLPRRARHTAPEAAPVLQTN
jgi:hypothetical protein